MKELTLLYTNIQHSIRRELDISCLEYALVDMIYHLSTKPDSAVIGWCYKSKDQLALEIGITKQGLLKMIDRLILCGLLEKNAETRYLKTTEKYFGKLFTDSKQSLPKGGKQSLPLGVNKVDPIIIANNNTNYNSSLPEEKKDEGFNLAAQEREQNPIKPHEMTTLTIEETKERFLNDNSIFEIFARGTRLERKNYEKAVGIFIEHTAKKVKYPRAYSRGTDHSEKHFLNWYVLRDLKEFTVSEIKPIVLIPQLTEEQKAEQQRLGKAQMASYMEKLKAQKEANDKIDLEKRKTNESNLRTLSSNISAKGVSAYLLP